MSDYEDFQDEFDRVSLGPSLPEDVDVYSSRGARNKDSVNVGSRRMPPPLRSRPHIDFSGQQLSSEVGLGFALPPVPRRPPSHMSGSTLHSSRNHPTASIYSQKQYSSYDLPPDLPPEVLASLTMAQLYQNPLHRQLQEKYEDLCDVLTKDARRDLMEPRIPQSHPTVLDIRQEPHRMDSRDSSLAPSDSASQQREDYPVIPQEYVDNLLQMVEPPATRPHRLPKTVLWDLEDCFYDPDQVTTELNKHRPKMTLAIREANGRKVSIEVYKKIRRATQLIVKQLVRDVNSNPRAALHVSVSWNKTWFQKWFPDEFNQAVLQLEAQKPLLRLCSAHWKAEAMITLLLQNEEGGKEPASNPPLHPSDANAFQFEEPRQVTPILPASVAAPSNVAKRALEFSPGPKSPSASRTQKRSKDDGMPSGQKPASSHSVHQRPTARRVAPSFLSRTEVINQDSVRETTPTRMRPIYVDPSADNLISILTSEFPSMSTAPNLLRSLDARRSFQRGETSEKVTTLLDRVQSADPGSPDYEEDDMGQGWGHYQFTAGGLSPATVLTSWQEVGSVDTAFKLVAAAIKTCREARLMCENAGATKTTGFLSDDYLELTLEHLEKCWVDAGGVLAPRLYPIIPTTPPTYSDVVMASISPSKAAPTSSPPKAAPMSPSRPAIKLKFKPLTDVAAASDAGNSIHQQLAGGKEPSTTLAQSNQDGIALLQSLHTPELQAWIVGRGLTLPKPPRRKNDFITTIVNSPEFAQVTKSSIEEIIAKRKQKRIVA